MTYQVPKRIATLEPYEPIKGTYDVRLDANESFISLPDDIRREIGEAVSQVAFNRYPDPDATELCKKFAEFYGIKPESVVAANGSDELLMMIMTYFGEREDKLLVTKPEFSMYGIYAETAGVMQIASVEKNDDFFIDADTIITAAKREQAKIFIMSNPCNPTSQLLGREEVLKIVESLPDTLVIMDEAYMDFAYGSVMDVVEQYDNLMVLKTFSKAFGMAGVRLGFAVTNPRLVNVLKAVKSPYNVNTMSQVVGSILLGHPDYIKKCIAEIQDSRDDLYKALQNLEKEKDDLYRVYPPSGNFMLLDVKDSKSVFEAGRERGIAIRLMGSRLRICAGSPKENRRVHQLLTDVLQ